MPSGEGAAPGDRPTAAPLPPPPAAAQPDAAQQKCGPPSGPPANGAAYDAATERQNVVLRVEVATKGQARLLTWSMWALSAVFVVAAVALSASVQSYDTLGNVRRLHIAQLCFGCLCTMGALVMLVWLGSSVQASRREQRVWSRHQRYFAWVAARLLIYQAGFSALYVASCALLVAQPDCYYPWTALSAMDFVKKLVFALYVYCVLACLVNMAVWRGPGALDAHPDRLLVLDQPRRVRALQQLPLTAILLGLLAEAIVALIGRVRHSETSQLANLAGCDLPLGDLDCHATKYQVTSASVGLGIMCLTLAMNAWVASRALRDHRALPLVRYRATNVFVRVQVRLMMPVIVAVLLATIFVGFVPVVVRHSCTSAVFLATGNLPIELSLALASSMIALLYMPKAAQLDSPVLQEFLQMFAWTLAAVGPDLKRRNERLVASEQAGKLARKAATAADVLFFVPQQLQGLLGRLLLRGPDLAAAEEQLQHEPMFCMQTAVIFLYWCRLAYIEYPKLDNEFVNIDTAMEALGMEQWETIWDPQSDTHAILAWSAATSQVAIAFRGTASLQNVMTDLKAYHVLHCPARKHRGRRVTCHAGFYSAWLSGGFNRRVLDRLQQIEAATKQPLRFWVTGHSLGGALAVLACSDIAREHPASQITCYTFGCPRVFNRAGAKEFNLAVPDCWSIINACDPVPWHPKWGFKRVGRRVNIDANGNLVLRPTFFELSIIHGAAIVADHLLDSYALSFAAIFKAQFSPIKCMEGGAEGVEQLAAALDLGRYLVLTHVDLASLRDPKVQPGVVGVRDAPENGGSGGQRRARLGGLGFGGCCGGAGRSRHGQRAAAPSRAGSGDEAVMVTGAAPTEGSNGGPPAANTLTPGTD